MCFVLQRTKAVNQVVLGIKRTADDLEVIVMFCFFSLLTCILLTDFEVYDASYGPCFFLLGFYGPLF